MAQFSLEAGYAAADLRQHASRPTVNGQQALCGAGRIVQPVAGRFRTELDSACDACLAALIPAQRDLVVA